MSTQPTQYIVLYPISLDTGLPIKPAPEGDPPVLIDEATLFATPSDLFTNEERATILINKGVIALAPAKVVAAWEKAQPREVAPAQIAPAQIATAHPSTDHPKTDKE